MMSEQPVSIGDTNEPEGGVLPPPKMDATDTPPPPIKEVPAPPTKGEDLYR